MTIRARKLEAMANVNAMSGTDGTLQHGLTEVPNRDLEASAAERIERRGWTLAVAESCTGGLVMKRLTDLPGSSRFLVGGVVAYDDRAKTSLLGIDGDLLRRHGAVSSEVAGAMAQGVVRALDTTMGLAVTGIAGPTGAVPGKPIGTVCFAVVVGEVVHYETVLFEGDRWRVRDRAARYAVDLLRRRADGAVLGSERAGENPGPASG